ncbi:hypothetical protein [Leptolyngbya sp. 7M]|uniref:hypothetical protein n=1 Tax=Leptolyngbya sp. 7M TaxID=2812896 RepID=UPI001B8D9CA5|nr:hypothetical protein [Leptolyngbya sp. 7M]QYO63909.1 hypothetical protein JVX88_29540 [Leptolyngbya sp. 7M]
MKIGKDSWLCRSSISNQSAKLFFLLLSTDICFFALHIVALMGGWSDSYPNLYKNPYLIEMDRGHAEFFQYMKEYWCILMLGFIALRRRSLLYLSWTCFFLYLLIDDYAEIHETLGFYLSELLNFAPMFRLRARDFGEVLVSTLVGLFFLIWIGTAYRLGDSTFRRVSRTLIILLSALAVFGIVVDMLHIMSPKTLKHVFGILEDGGEMIVMSTITTFLFVVSNESISNKVLSAK